MANNEVNYPKPKDTLRANYVPHECHYQILFEVDGETKVVEPIYTPNFDCNGRYMRDILYDVYEQVADYGIDFYDIAKAFRKYFKDTNQRPPKIMYD